MEILEINMGNLMSTWPLPLTERSGWVLSTWEGSKHPWEIPADSVMENAIDNWSKIEYV